MVRSDKAIRFESQIKNCQKIFGSSKSSCNTKKEFEQPYLGYSYIALDDNSERENGKNSLEHDNKAGTDASTAA